MWINFLDAGCWPEWFPLRRFARYTAELDDHWSFSIGGQLRVQFRVGKKAEQLAQGEGS